MPIFEIKYSFDIRDNQTEELSYWERGSFEVEAPTKKEIDGDSLRNKINQLARKHCTKTQEVVAYANYYGIEEIH